MPAIPSATTVFQGPRSTDEIAVVEHGRIVERGTHDALLVSDSLKDQLAEQQERVGAGTNEVMLLRDLRGVERQRGVGDHSAGTQEETVVLPAATDTALWDSIPGEWNRVNMLQADDVARAIAMDGHETVTAQDGAEALEILTRERGTFDLLLTDIQMPIMDGIALSLAVADGAWKITGVEGYVESAAVGLKQAYAPMVDVSHEPRWGRIAEGAGEDPYLGAAIAAGREGFGRLAAILGGDLTLTSEPDVGTTIVPPHFVEVVCGLGAGDELARVERLRQVVVGADLEADDAVDVFHLGERRRQRELEVTVALDHRRDAVGRRPDRRLGGSNHGQRWLCWSVGHLPNRFGGGSDVPAGRRRRSAGSAARFRRGRR